MKTRSTLLLLLIAALCAPAIGQKPKAKQRLPLYFVDGELVRDGKVLHRFFYRHHGSFE